MNKEKDIERRWVIINRLFLLLGVAMLATVLLREFLLFRQNVNFFSDQLYQNQMQDLSQEVDNRVEQIESMQLSYSNTFLDEIKSHITLANFFAMQQLDGVSESMTLEEKQESYIDIMLQYNENHDDLLVFVFDLDGILYLSGLAKDLEGTNMLDRQDVVTGDYFFREFIETVESSPTNDGFVSYHWMREVNGEHVKKTSYLLYNEELDLVVATGMYEIDYRDEMLEILWNEFDSYYSKNDYVYVIGYDGSILYHPRNDFETENLLNLLTTDGEPFHEYILGELDSNEDVVVKYDFNIDDTPEIKTGYIRGLDDWELYVGRSLIEQDLVVIRQEYMNNVLPGFIIYNISMIALFLGISIVIHMMIVSNFTDVEHLFALKNSQLKDLSFRDQLTHLYNRQMFVELMDEFTGHDHEIAILMFDANGLKLINDTYGHKVGDELLVKLSDTLRSSFKGSYIFRWGGDEFVVVIKDSDETVVLEQMDYFKKLIENTSVENYKLSAAVGYAIDIAREDNIYEMLDQAEKMMYDEKTHSSMDIKRNMIDHLLDKLYEVDIIEKNHSQNVVKYALLIGTELGFSAEDLNELRLSAMLHDVGKIGISQDILMKDSPLTESEYDLIRNHSEKGYRILSSYSSLSTYAPYVLSHHEWFNGSGYPKGLKGKNIPLISRILSIADAFDAMVSERTYHERKTYTDAMNELITLSGKQFDPELVKIFMKALPESSFNEMRDE